MAWGGAIEWAWILTARADKERGEKQRFMRGDEANIRKCRDENVLNSDFQYLFMKSITVGGIGPEPEVEREATVLFLRS